MVLSVRDSKIREVTIDFKKYWNTTYLKNQTESLGWYEKKIGANIGINSRDKITKKCYNFKYWCWMFMFNLYKKDFLISLRMIYQMNL
jgi:hypothetical protein